MFGLLADEAPPILISAPWYGFLSFQVFMCDMNNWYSAYNLMKKIRSV